jgi:hypothetical protein
MTLNIRNGLFASQSLNPIVMRASGILAEGIRFIAEHPKPSDDGKLLALLVKFDFPKIDAQGQRIGNEREKAHDQCRAQEEVPVGIILRNH